MALHTCKKCGKQFSDIVTFCPACKTPRVEGTTQKPYRGTQAGAISHKKGKRLASSLNGVCPKCGSTQFEAVRSTKRKVAFGLASLLAPANEVRCVMCKTRFARG